MNGETATVLVVDDESMVRTLVRRMLEPAVCAVVEAGDGESALRLIERGQPAIDVVLTDMKMPGIDGYDIVTVLARHRPDLPVVCMSGFASVAKDRLTVPFVPKPFSFDTLRAALDPVIARSRELRPLAGEGGRRASERSGASGRPRRVSGARRTDAVDLVAAALELRRQRAEPPGTS
jgi:two-component system cell cycle sensor histidine kinase/response regulator CckA